MKIIKVFIFILVEFIFANGKKDLDVDYSWKQLSFEWPSAQAKREAIQTGKYIEGNNSPLGIEVWKNKVFLTVPR
jgi:hypothetical protein